MLFTLCNFSFCIKKIETGQFQHFPSHKIQRKAIISFNGDPVKIQCLTCTYHQVLQYMYISVNLYDHFNYCSLRKQEIFGRKAWLARKKSTKNNFPLFIIKRLPKLQKQLKFFATKHKILSLSQYASRNCANAITETFKYKIQKNGQQNRVLVWFIDLIRSK